jgi:uncharacterized protein
MLKYSKILLIATVLVIGQYLQAQSSEDFGFTSKLLNPVVTPKTQFINEVKESTDEVKFIFSSLFYLYKTLLSSQDLSVCTFHPSCSEYGIRAVKAKGVIIGGIQTFDRLTRCNGMSPDNYEKDFGKRKLIDPVK